jgi:hypothetical protein
MNELSLVFARAQKMRCFCIALSAMLAVGCGHGMGDVQGRVTIDGEPLTNTIIYFEPSRGPLAQSALDEGGKYRLETPGIGRGVSPGGYRVYLVARLSDDDESVRTVVRESDLVAGKAPPPMIVPKIHPRVTKYYSSTTTDWHREVEPGSNEFDFELVTK